MEGDYPEGDYGDAGVSGDAVAGGTEALAEEGEYPEGDYGTAGTASGERGSRRAADRSAEDVSRDEG